ncbi:MAG: carboxypeptidase [Clostridia bacterium]|nr:carboxypeptidase [Clostridia bacterium]
MEKAEVISVIKTKSTRGDGTSANPSRIVIQYWSFDGTLLFEEDPAVKQEKQFQHRA